MTPDTAAYTGCLKAVHHEAVDCPSSGLPMDSWCSPCATRSHLIDEHMGCMGAAAPLVTRIAGADAETLAEMHNVAHAQRRADGREDHEHAHNVWQPNPNYTL